MRPSLYPRALGWNLSGLEQIQIAADSGFSSIDLAVRDLQHQGHDPAELRKALDNHGLVAGCFPLPLDWRRLDTAVQHAQLTELPRLAESARTLGLQAASTWVPPACDNLARATARAARPPILPPRDLDPEGFLGLHLAMLAPAARILHAHGLRLALEVIGVESFRRTRGTPFIHRLDDPRLDWLLNALNQIVGSSPFGMVGVLCDTYHLHAAGESVATALRHGPGSIAWVQVADLPRDFSGTRSEIRDDDRGLPGESGVVPIREILSSLAAVGYAGPVTAEPLPNCRALVDLPPIEQAHRLRAALASVWPSA